MMMKKVLCFIMFVFFIVPGMLMESNIIEFGGQWQYVLGTIFLAVAMLIPMSMRSREDRKLDKKGY